MLLFRSEEHIDRWCATWRLPRGAAFTLDQCWRLAQVWYGTPRTAPDWRRRTLEETQAVFAELGFVGEFWDLE